MPCVNKTIAACVPAFSKKKNQQNQQVTDAMKITSDASCTMGL
jgi:hypothetical protein